jgi:hypothetical protein
MKKILRKKYFVPLLVVAVMAIAATAAYAWWTTNAQSDPNTVATGTSGLELGGQLPINVSKLIPAQPLLDNDDQTVPAGAYKVSYFWVHNTGDEPLPFIGWLDNGTGDYALLGSQVYVKILIAPTDSPYNVAGSLSSEAGHAWKVYYGPIDALYGKTAGGSHLTTDGHADLQPGQYAVYKVITWLNGPTCDNSSKDKTMGFTVNFESPIP